jgi:hypothetical protein
VSDAAPETLAREAIRDLVARYNGYGDAGRWDQLWELFAPEAVMVIRRRGAPEDERRHEGIESIKGIFTGAAEVVTGDRAARPPAFVRHHTATHVIDVVDADHATGRLYFQVLTDAGLDHWGRYADGYLRTDEGWRFAERAVTTDGWSPTSAFVTG